MGTACRFRPQRASVRCKDAAEGGDVPPPRSVRRNKACRLTAVTRSPSAAAQVFAAEFGWNHEIADPVPCHGTGSFPLLTVVFARGAVLWYLPAEFWPAGDRRERGADRTNGRICGHLSAAAAGRDGTELPVCGASAHASRGKRRRANDQDQDDRRVSQERMSGHVEDHTEKRRRYRGGGEHHGGRVLPDAVDGAVPQRVRRTRRRQGRRPAHAADGGRVGRDPDLRRSRRAKSVLAHRVAHHGAGDQAAVPGREADDRPVDR